MDHGGSDPSTVDVVVLRFALAQGAQARALAGAGDALSPSGSAGQELSIPGLPGYVYPKRSTNAGGYLDAVYYTSVGNLMAAVHFGSYGSFDPATFAPWAVGVYLTLRTAQIPAASAATIPAATTECSPLTACLMPVPAGGTAFTDGWAGETTPTVSQFVQEMYSSSYLTTATGQLQSEGLSGIVHTMWQDAAGNQFDMNLLQFKTLQGAQARARTEITGISGPQFSVSGPGAAKGGYSTTADSQGYFHYAVYGSVGTVAVELHAFAKTASEGQGLATDVAQQQLEKLAAVTTTSTTPQAAVVVSSTVPSKISGTSACTDVVSCLMPMPTGATARGASNYNDSVQVTATSSPTRCTRRRLGQ